MSTAAVAGPIPGTDWSKRCRCALPQRTGFERGSQVACLVSFTRCSSQWMCARTSRRDRPVASGKRMRSAVSMSTSCRRRVTRAARACGPRRASGRGSGRTRSANRAKTWASSASVFARRPSARAKSRTCRGLTSVTGRPASANARGDLGLVAAGGFEHDQRRRERPQVRDEGGDALVRMGHPRWRRVPVRRRHRDAISKRRDPRRAVSDIAALLRPRPTLRMRASRTRHLYGL